jgi:hypothetical protein
VADLQRDVVPKDGVMLEYHVGEHASHLFVVPRAARCRRSR